jgi:2-methylcitrate dehydratase PrpD
MKFVKESSNATKRLAEFCAATSYRDLSPEAIHATKRMTLDSIGVGLMGSLLPKGKMVIDCMQEIGNGSQATIFSSSVKVPVHNAAFANAELLNGTEMEPVFQNFAHITTYVFPAILSMAEYAKASGRDLILALALGFDIAARLGLSLSPIAYLEGDGTDVSKMDFGELETYGFGWASFGCAAGGGKLFGFDEKRMANAFGLAGYTALVPSMSRYMAAIPASMIRYTAAGWQSQNAVLAVLLARKGYTGDKAVLDGATGFWKFWGSIRWDSDTLLKALGKEWLVTSQTFKKWPVCSLSNSQIELTRRLVEEHKLKPNEIESITYYGHPFCQSELHKTKMLSDEMEAMFNASYAIAMSVMGVEPLDWVLDRSWWRNEDVLQLMEKVNIEVHPKTKELVYAQIGTKPYPGIFRWPAEIVIKARGKTYRGYQEYFKGHDAILDSRLSDEELQVKFLNCARRVLPKEKCNRIINSVMHMDKLDDINTLTNELF